MERGTAILTIEEVAERLKMSKRTVLRMCQSGELRATKIRNLWRIREDSLDELTTESAK